MNLYELNSLKTFITLLKSVELSQVYQKKRETAWLEIIFFFNMEFEVTEKMIMHDYFPIRKKKLIKI